MPDTVARTSGLSFKGIGCGAISVANFSIPVKGPVQDIACEIGENGTKAAPPFGFLPSIAQLVAVAALMSMMTGIVSLQHTYALQFLVWRQTSQHL